MNRTLIIFLSILHLLSWSSRAVEVAYVTDVEGSYEKQAAEIRIAGTKMEYVYIAVKTTGVLDGAPADFRYRLNINSPSPIGTRLSDGSIIIAPVHEGYLSFQLGEKFKPLYRQVTAEEASTGHTPFKRKRISCSDLLKVV